MVERHYNRFLVERRAHLVNGAPEEALDFTDEDGTPWHWDAADWPTRRVGARLKALALPLWPPELSRFGAALVRYGLTPTRQP